jgi:carboxyl-terminal processing protease
LRPLLVIATVASAFCVTFVWPRENGLGVDIDVSPRAQAAKKRAPYDLSEIRVLRAVVAKVHHNYVEPQRIDQKKMLLAGLNAIQGAVAPVLVHYDNGTSFRVQVDAKTREFRADDVNSMWALTDRFKDVFRFLQKQLGQDEDVDLKEVEYAAVNGMLRTLDPHSVLLDPDDYDEMSLTTRGEFGGLGIVISIRDGQLTIIRPMPGTPADNAGLKKKDRIVQIDDESTLNMPLEEAVSRLRGAPGSGVAVWIVREGPKGWTKSRRFDLVRDRIQIESVESRMLSGNIGYVKVLNFQANTTSDVNEALEKLRGQGMRGLVLDFRDNPGGLLQQAVLVADLFLSSGTIVTTDSSDPEKRDRKLARAEGTEPMYPMIVLQNGGSASASEIVSGALKNHDRALIVGERTFGKGSVQVLYPDEAERWALKLTIAQYLTPGDVSIQGVGIPPDIEIDPMTVDPLDMNLTVDSSYMRESDLSAHLTHQAVRNGQEPEQVLRYYLPLETRQRLREATPEDVEENESEDEFLTRFSAELLSRAQLPGRRELLREATPVLDATRAKEMQRAEAELKRLGITWSSGPDRGPSQVDVQLSTNRPDNVGIAGQPFELRAQVTNRGQAPLYQLRAITKSDNPLFNERELVFGSLAPGETRRWSTTLGFCRTDEESKERKCTLPQALIDRADGIRVEFSEAHGHAPATAEIRTRVQALPTPEFAYTVHVADNGRGNGDGDLQRGELATVYLRLRNVGKGTSEKTVADLRNLSGKGILLRAGRFQLGEVKRGEERMVAFTFEVLPDFEGDEAKLEVVVGDTALRVRAGEKLELPVRPSATGSVRAASGTVTLRDGARILEHPADGTRPVARVAGGSVALPAQAALGNHTRVDLGEGRPGWVAQADLLGAAGMGGTIADVLAHMPPVLEVDHGSTLVTRQDSLRIKGSARDDTLLRDLYVFVGARKVYYQSNRAAADPKGAAFEATLPLRPGINFVTVVARENNEVMSRKTFIVRRDAPDGSLIETPKDDDTPFFAAADDAEEE